MPIDAQTFKHALSRWATGVTIVTSRAGEEIHGMTVSDFCGASLSPPLVTICASKDSDTTKLIARGGCFAVNLLSAGQADLSNRFASRKDPEKRFEGVAWTTARTGAPLIPGALVQLDCTLVASHDAGDHVIYVGEIEQAQVGEGAPLVHFAGAYRALAGE